MEDPPNKKQKLEDTDIFQNIRIEETASGLKYYIAENDLPPGNGIVSLVVKTGFLREEKREAGIAHLLEHVLLRGVVEATRSPFGQRMFSNELHETTRSYTIFSVQVHGEEEFLEAIKMLNLIAKQEVLIQDQHVDLEKKIVTVEYLTKLQGDSEIAGDSFHAQLFEMSSPATCIDNLTEINSVVLTNFYRTRYIPSCMGFIATGNLNIEKLLTEALERPSKDYVQGVDTTPSWTFEVKILNDSDNQGALVFKLRRPLDLLQNVVMMILVRATSKRLIASGGRAYTTGKGLDVFIVFRHSDAQKVVYEFFRLKELGLTTSEFEREINVIKRKLRREAKLFCLDEQHQINVLQKKLRNNFLYDQPVTSLDSELQLVAASDSLQDLASQFLGHLIIEQAMLYVSKSCSNSAESFLEVKNQAMHQWEDGRRIDNFVGICEDTHPTSTTECKEFGTRELHLINGMRIILCKSEIPPFEVHMKGFAYGGLSEQNERDYVSSYFGLGFVQQLRSFPLNFRLRGNEDLKIQLKVDDYLRSFEAVFDVSEMEILLQYIYLLFHKKPQLENEDHPEKLLSDALDKWVEERKPWQIVYEFATEPSFIHRVPYVTPSVGVDFEIATTFVSSCFLDPAQFTIVFAGDFDMVEIEKLVLKYMGSIPRLPCQNFPADRKDITVFPMNFPREVSRLEVNVNASQAYNEVYICVPLMIDREKQDDDKIFIQFLKMIVIDKLIRVLRQELGEVSSVEGSILFDGKRHSSTESDEAILAVTFSYHAVKMDWELVNVALESIENLQNALSKEDITCLSYSSEPSKVSSSTILDKVIESCQSNEYTGDLGKTMMARMKFVESIPFDDVEFWEEIFHRIMPQKSTERSVCVVFHDKGEDDSKDRKFLDILHEYRDSDSEEFLDILISYYDSGEFLHSLDAYHRSDSEEGDSEGDSDSEEGDSDSEEGD